MTALISKGTSQEKRHIAISLPILLFIFASILTGGYKVYILYKCIICVLFFLSLLLVSQKFWTTCFKKNGKIIIIIFTLLFGFLHLSNFEIQLKFFPLYLLYCTPQVVMGITFTYLRLNAGFSWALLGHIAANSLSVLLSSVANQ